MRPPGGDVQPPRGAVVAELDHGAVGQLAGDLVQGDRGDGGGAGALDHGIGAVQHLDVEVGGAEADLVALGLDQQVGEDRNGVAALDDGLRLADRLEQRRAFDADLHVPLPRSRANPGRRLPEAAPGFNAFRARLARFRPNRALGAILARVARSAGSCGPRRRDNR